MCIRDRYAGNVGYIAPKDFGFMKSIDILMIVVIGGLGNIWGTFGAAILMNIVSMLLQDLSEIRMIVYALVLILIMLVKSGETPIFVKLRTVIGKYLNVRALKPVSYTHLDVYKRQGESSGHHCSVPGRRRL